VASLVGCHGTPYKNTDALLTTNIFTNYGKMQSLIENFFDLGTPTDFILDTPLTEGP
jgi:hypothetical protein